VFFLGLIVCDNAGVMTHSYACLLTHLYAATTRPKKRDEAEPAIHRTAAHDTSFTRNQNKQNQKKKKKRQWSSRIVLLVIFACAKKIVAAYD